MSRLDMAMTFTPILIVVPGDSVATREVAGAIAEVFRDEGLAAELRTLEELHGLNGYGTVVLGAPFEGSQWSEEARAFLLAHRDALIALPVAIFATAPPVDGAEDMATSRSELLEELAHLRWLHPIGADLFLAMERPALARPASRVASLNGFSGGAMSAFDAEAVRTWARWVATVLQPSAR
jgi:hypothetical protein